MEHHAHHALPVIPLYNLQAAQRRMRGAFPDIHAVYMSPQMFCRIVDACKLYDYDARDWTDLDGRATGPVLIVGEATIDPPSSVVPTGVAVN